MSRVHFLRTTFVFAISARLYIYIYIFSIRAFFQTLTIQCLKESPDRKSRGREGITFYFTLPILPTHEHSDICLQLCMWDDYHVFLIATLVFIWLLLNEIYHLIDWWCNVCLFTWSCDYRFSKQFDTDNRWVWTRIDYHL